jgi:hypothetical protein
MGGGRKEDSVVEHQNIFWGMFYMLYQINYKNLLP